MHPFMPKPEAGGEQKGPFYLANNFKKATPAVAAPKKEEVQKDDGEQKEPASTEPDLLEDDSDDDVPF
jgi:hypothetical protein